MAKTLIFLKMTTNLQQQILLLDRDERLRLVQYIIDSIRFEDLEASREGALSADQQAELSRRSASIRNGTAQFTTWEEIRAGLKST